MAYIGNPIVSTDFPKDKFSGNGSTTAFTMSIAPASVNSVLVIVSGITQSPDTYTISGTTLTFSAAPPTGTDNILVRHLGVAGIPNTPSAASVVTTSIADSNVTTAKIADANITQAKLASGVVGTGPAFSAYAGAVTSVSSGTATKINFDTEEFDTNSNFASSRFTPTVAGYYQVSTMVAWTTSNTANVVYIAVYKNGSANKLLSRISKNGQYMWLTGSTLVYCNGTTDYLEIYGYQDAGLSINTDNGFGYTWFTGALVRAA